MNRYMYEDYDSSTYAMQWNVTVVESSFDSIAE